MAKLKTPAKLMDECAVLLQKIVRMKAAIHAGSPLIQCVTCGQVKHWKEMHGGHFIPRTYRAHKLLEENIHPQCPGCNTFRPERVADDYNQYMREMYGHEFVEELTRTKRDITKRTRAELEDIKSEFRARVKELESQCEELEWV